MKLICLSILILLLRSYLILYLSVVLHELSHFAIAKLIGLRDVFLCIGFYGVLGVKGKNFFISPLAFSGHVSVDTASLKSLNKLKQASFWMSGMFANLVGIVVGLLVGYWLIAFINLCIILTCGIPIPFLKNDMYCFLKEQGFFG